MMTAEGIEKAANPPIGLTKTAKASAFSAS